MWEGNIEAIFSDDGGFTWYVSDPFQQMAYRRLLL